jgi:hypothetical protein
MRKRIVSMLVVGVLSLVAARLKRPLGTSTRRLARAAASRRTSTGGATSASRWHSNPTARSSARGTPPRSASSLLPSLSRATTRTARSTAPSAAGARSPRASAVHCRRRPMSPFSRTGRSWPSASPTATSELLGTTPKARSRPVSAPAVWSRPTSEVSTKRTALRFSPTERSSWSASSSTPWGSPATTPTARDQRRRKDRRRRGSNFRRQRLLGHPLQRGRLSRLQLRHRRDRHRRLRRVRHGLRCRAHRGRQDHRRGCDETRRARLAR